MTAVRITPMAPERYGVQVEEGPTVTSHEVVVPARLLDDLGLGGTDPAAVVEETLAFLLEREPATSILREFSLEDVTRYFPGFYDELRTRLAA